MTPEEWADTWKKAGPALEAVRLRELRAIDTPTAIANLSDAFEHAIRQTHPVQHRV